MKPVSVTIQVKATEQYFSLGVVYYAVKSGLKIACQ